MTYIDVRLVDLRATPGRSPRCKGQGVTDRTDEQLPGEEPLLSPQFDQALTRSVGDRVKAERQRRRLTLQDVAGRCHLSAGMLSKIENAQISPSLRTLGRLARALEVPVTAFFRGIDEEHDASFVKAGHGIALSRPGAAQGHRYELLAVPFQQRRRMEAWLVSLPEPSEAFPLYQHDGSELIFMLEGRLMWHYGRQTFDMEPGDSLLLDATVAHGPEQLIDVPAKFLAISIEECPADGREEN